MATSSTRNLAALTTLLALALAPAKASAALERVGPNSPANFLPTWYQDTTGLTLEFCTPLSPLELADGWCLILPADVPGGVTPEIFPNAFSGEHFFWASDVTGDWSHTNSAAGTTLTGRVVFVQAIEAAFLGDIGPGLGGVFGRVRIRVLDLPLTGIYKFYTPWGIKEIAGLAGDRIFDSEDIGINCAPFQYDCALQTSIGPFLVPSDSPGGAELPPVAGPTPGTLYLADPARIGPVTGSPIQGNYTIANVGGFTATSGIPVNPNVFAIEAPDGQVIFKSHDFTSMGRIYTDVIPSRLAVDRASYARDASGVRVDVYATGEPTLVPRLPAQPVTTPLQPLLAFYDAPCTGTTDPQGQLLPPFGPPGGLSAISMNRNGNIYWGATAPAAIPAGVCLVDQDARNAGGQVVPTYLPGALGDQVFITAAVFDPSNGGSLSVRASSSDVLAPPILSVGAFGGVAANVPLADDLAFITPLAAPPSKVRVYSQEGGSTEYLVKTGSRVATGVTLASDKPSPQAPGTSVVFKAQGEGSVEYLYRFWLHDAGGTTLVQDWSRSDVWALPSTLGEGTYQVTADVWSGLSPVAPDATSAPVAMTLRYPAATNLSLVAAPGNSATAGTPVVFAASASGSSNYRYRFSLSIAGSPYAEVQPYGPDPLWTMPGTTPIGLHSVRVEVVTSSLASGPDQTTTLAYELRNTPATGVTLAQDVPGVVVFGTPVTYTATATGPAGAPYQYRFLASADNGATWGQARAFGSSPTWTTTGTAAVGNWLVAVEVRTSSLVARDAISLAVLARVIIPPATGVSLAQNVAGVVAFGASVTYTATATGPAGAPYQYRFLASADNGATWGQARGYDPSPTWTTTGSAAVGNWLVAVEVRTSSLVARDAVSLALLTRVVIVPATGVSLAQDVPGVVALGTPVTYTATATGPAGAPYQYRFLASADGGASWGQARGYDPSPTWTTSGTAAPGSWLVAVEVRTSSLVARDAISPPLLTIVSPAP